MNILLDTIKCATALTKARHAMSDKEETDTLEVSAKAAFRHAKEMMFEGSVPTYLGINGMLALMHSNIKSFIDDPTEDALLSLVAHGIHALALQKEEEEWDEYEEEEEEEEEDILDDGEFIAGPSFDDRAPSSEFATPGDEVDDPRFVPAPDQAELRGIPTMHPLEGDDDEEG